MKKTWVIIFTVILLMASAIFGCGKSKTAPPAKKPSKPKIPDKITQGEGVEPVLKVYKFKEHNIEEMKLEDYVAGVVAGEVENYWPKQALAAQAILARTYVLEFIEDKGGSKYGDAHISTDFEEAQAWNPDNINDNIKQAVKSTRGQVVTYKGKYIKAWFHSHAGGMTATAEEGLEFKEGNPPYINVVKSPDEDIGPAGKKTWKASFTKEQIAQAARTVGEEPGIINDVSIQERGPSGRATVLKIGDASVPAASFRIALGSMDMRSTLLTSIKTVGDKVTMAGKGFGHGVGLSQWGANALAKQKKSPEDIIKHYFKDVEIVQLWK